MSEEHVDRFTRAVEAGNRRDFDLVLDFCDPEVEWHAGMTALVTGEAAAVYRGREGVRRAMQEGLFGAFDEVHLELTEVRDLGDRILGIGVMRARGAESGVEIESPWAWLIQLKEGKAIWVRSYLDREEALEAAGLSG